MWFLVFFIALAAFAAGYFYGWYMAEEALSEPSFGSPDDSDRFYMDEKLSHTKADKDLK